MKKWGLIFGLILSLLSFKKAHATIYYYDTFSTGSLEKWVIGSGSTENGWYVENNELIGSVAEGDWSIIYADWDNLSRGDYKVTSKVKNISGVDQIFLVRVSSDRSKYYQIDYRYNEPKWGQDNNNITIYKFDNGHQFVAQYPVPGGTRTFDLTQNEEHKIVIRLEWRNIKVYFDDELAIDYYDWTSTPLLEGGVGLKNWSGQCPVGTENHF